MLFCIILTYFISLSLSLSLSLHDCFWEIHFTEIFFTAFQFLVKRFSQAC
jgi:hypothetical protein